jgi:hypothetical protein
VEKVRLRITRALSGSIDGIHLSQFVVGEVYDVGTSVGSFLLSVGAAEPLGDVASEEAVTRGISPSLRPRHQAADHSRRRQSS